MSDENHDPFEEVTEVQESQEEAQADTEKEESAEETTQEDSGEQENAETPSATEEVKDKTEKMIPESRFKAAIKDVTAERDELRAKLASQQPIPDKETDPEGYDLHLRIETSKEIAQEIYPDYSEKIAYYQEMAKENPYLNQQVAAAKNPAKFAYDLATKAMEIAELATLKNSDDWKEFQKWKKEQRNSSKETTTKAQDTLNLKPQSKVVPVNLNRVTNVAKEKMSSVQEDDLFADSKF